MKIHSTRLRSLGVGSPNPTINKYIEAVHPNTSNLDFKCNICVYVYNGNLVRQGFFSQLQLDSHILQEHDGKNHFECDNCDYKCSKKDQLVNHTCSLDNNSSHFSNHHCPVHLIFSCFGF